MLFDNNPIIVKERITPLSRKDIFDLFDSQGTKIGEVREPFVFLGTAFKIFKLNVFEASPDGNVSDKPILKMKKPFTFIRGRINVYDDNDMLIGYFLRKMISITQQYWIFNANNEKLGKVVGNIIHWNFNIVDNDDNIVASVKKKFAGVIKEVFSSADAYMIDFGNSNIDKRLVFAVPLMMDQVFELNNDNRR
ncbi:LURP-one-related family protein [Nanoarchaeota archaeon]